MIPAQKRLWSTKPEICWHKLYACKRKGEFRVVVVVVVDGGFFVFVGEK
jgi:hypothetical protein